MVPNKTSREVLDGQMEYQTTFRRNLIKKTDEMSLASLTDEEDGKRTKVMSLKKSPGVIFNLLQHTVGLQSQELERQDLASLQYRDRIELGFKPVKGHVNQLIQESKI